LSTERKVSTALHHSLQPPSSLTIGDLFDRFGAMSLSRIRTSPRPGTARERDVLRIRERERRLCELVDGILVEKAVGYEESVVAATLIMLLGNFVSAHKLGVVTGEGGIMKLAAGLVRIPDVAFVARKRLPGGKVPRQAIPALAPNLAVEVLSRANTPEEMQQKLIDYFDAGVELVWHVDPRARTVAVFTSAVDVTVLKASQSLTGGKVLPGFKIKIRELFADLSNN
jgi:Uma2 family endonuclease